MQKRLNVIISICFNTNLLTSVIDPLVDTLVSVARRGAIITTFIVCYALTSFISGYVSGGLYSRSGGMHHRFIFIILVVLLFN